MNGLKTNAKNSNHYPISNEFNIEFCIALRERKFLNIAYEDNPKRYRTEFMHNYQVRLTGGHPNSLGNTVEIVEDVLLHPERFDELFNCYFSPDEVVRLRTSNAMKRICKEKKELLVPYIERFLTQIANIDQASTQWTIAQLFAMLKKEMSSNQQDRATKIMMHNLETHDDWIVLNMTMDTLGKWAKHDQALENWIAPHLSRLAKDKRKSVAKKAQKLLTTLSS